LPAGGPTRMVLVASSPIWRSLTLGLSKKCSRVRHIRRSELVIAMYRALLDLPLRRSIVLGPRLGFDPVDDQGLQIGDRGRLVDPAARHLP
jgi:hypothetical protein